MSKTTAPHHARILFLGSVFLALAWLALSATPARAVTYALGTSALLAGPAAGSNGVVLAVTPQTGAWSAAANSPWLHLSAANQSGTGSTNIVFTYDANAGATRSGTLTISGLTLTVTQAGSTYIAAQPMVTLVSTGGMYSYSGAGVAADNAGNVYFSDPNGQRIADWTASNNAVTVPVSLGLFTPLGVAVDSAGNLYIADENHNAIKEWTVPGHTLITLVSSNATTPLNHPAAVAVDPTGNVYIADTGNNAIKEWTVANSNVATLVSSGLNNPTGVAVDAAGNVYIADFQHSAVKEWMAANSNVITLVSTGLESPQGVAVDGAGNVYIADVNAGLLGEWSAASKSLIILTNLDVLPNSVAVDNAGNIFIANSADNNVLQELPHAFVDTTSKSETVGAGNDVLPVVVPATANLLAAFPPTSDQLWLTITGVTNGVVGFSFASNPFIISRTAHITLLGQTILVTQGGIPYALGATARLEGMAAGSDSVVLAAASQTATWTATANAGWLHLSAANQSGQGSTNVIFTYDANAGATRSGTLTIAGLTLTVTQAGSTYVQANFVTNLVNFAGANTPSGVAVDGAGNVFFSDTDAGTPLISEWAVTNSSINFLLESGLSNPTGVAVDAADNIYIADTFHSAVKEFTPATSSLNTLISSGVNEPYGVALDSGGNVYIADTLNNAVKEWTVANNTLATVVSTGLSNPYGVAVDAAGNVYVADTGNSLIKKWTAANSNVTTLVSSGLSNPKGVAVDGAGNVYIADTGNSATKKWTAASKTVATLPYPGSYQPVGVAVDAAGNVYIVNGGNSPIEELSRAFVDPTPKFEPATAGNDILPVVLPATANLLGIFTPASDQPWWLTITGSSNGVVKFSFAANPAPSPSRTAHITLLGQPISVTQAGVPYALAATALLEGPASGSDSAVLGVWPLNAAWTNTANAGWLHLSAPNQSGAGSTNIVFTFDDNTGATRTGTLTVAGLTLSVTQAGATYVPAQPLTTLVYSGLNAPQGVAVDSAGNVYIADTGNFAVEKWTLANNTLSTLVSSASAPFTFEPPAPTGVAVDSLGNVYIADTNYASIDKWSPSNNTVTILTDTQIANVSFIPYGVAVDGAGNLYIADTNYEAIEEWTPSNGAVTTLISSGLYNPFGVAVDLAGNLYIADTFNQVIEEWTPANQALSTLTASVSSPSGVAVDKGGNVYIADYANQALYEWTAANGNLTALSSGAYIPYAVAVDGARNVYFADTNNDVIEELPYAFVDPTSKSESGTAGSDVLPAVLPPTANLLAPFAPTSDQSWLTIGGITNGVVSFSFTANTDSSRTANITLLGQTISVTQGAAITATPPALTGVKTLGKGILQFGFTNDPSATFTVLSATNLSLPFSNWTVVGTASNTSSDVFQFTSQPTTNDPARFYRVRSP